MDIKELKTKVLNNSLDDKILVLRYQDNNFLCNQYIDQICKNKNKTRVEIESLDEINHKSNFDIFESQDNNLYVLQIKKLDKNVNLDATNIIIVCQEVDSDINIDFIEMPKLLNWQIEDYMKVKCPGLNENEIKWLCTNANYDIYRLNNEALKLELFNPQMQTIIFTNINNENGYCDINNLNIFNFTTALIKKDLNTLNAILKDIEYIDIEGTGLVTILIKNIKNIIDIQFNPKATPTSLNMSDKQFNFVKYNVGKYTGTQLIKMYEFLTGIDYKLKSGLLQFDFDTKQNNLKLVDYVTVNILTIMYN